ncbi:MULTISPECIES: hypothetical protein [unclassified Halomonas]|uniref:hypothetical protein n=1 Tax=unclassified Halomonas TaxID=2609666 RepID=UPI000556BC55|nr:MULTISPECIES: hypothetical protein [unclassified Halomonas]CEP34092.1 Putative uncharacterized protein [Halomonas sp. R57-5]
MHNKKIKTKVDKMFNDLRTEVTKILDETNSFNDSVHRISQRVSSEMVSRSKNILSDMLFELDDALFETPFFATHITRQNEFLALNLRQEILNKYQFTLNTTVDYQEAPRIMQAAKVGGGVLAIGGISTIGAVLATGLSVSNLVPVPVGLLFAAAFGAAMTNYLIVEPNRNKKNLYLAIEKYLSEAQQQIHNWFNEVENYFDRRAGEIKQHMS